MTKNPTCGHKMSSIFAEGSILAAPTFLLLLLWTFFDFLSVFISQTAQCTAQCQVLTLEPFSQKGLKQEES